MQPQKSRPGPRATSCLTCRHRRKKCDLSRPFCDRCTKGEFKCLGYGDNETSESGLLEIHETPGASNRSELKSIQPMAVPATESDPNWYQPQHTSSVLDWFFDESTPSIFGAVLLDHTTRNIPHTTNNYSPSALDARFNSLWPQDQSRSITRRAPSFRIASPTSDIPGSPRVDLLGPINRSIELVLESIPRSVDANSSMRESYVTYILTEYELRRVRNFFQSPPPLLRNGLMARLRGSKTIIWPMYLGAKVFQVLTENPGSTAIQPYVHWINRLDQQFTNDTRRNSPLSDIGDHLLAQLELAFLKFVVVDSPSGYSLFRRLLPKFLHLVSTDPSLYTERPNGQLAVSFARALAAPRYELARFVVYDTTTALILGLAPLVEYEYNYEPEGNSHALEWVHGIPVELLASIAQVNAWRGGTWGVAVDNWQSLERRALEWEPRLSNVLESEGLVVKRVARLAVQESWRHLVLIYIYMGMCGVSSHDLRVQASVRQIVQLMEVASHSDIDVHLFAHCVVAGLAARYEKHRSIIRAKLLSFQDMRVWLFRGTDFTAVLDHLWHGVGANGEPVMWDDYVRSRCAVVLI